MMHEVYGLIDPRNGKIFYVGYSANTRQRIMHHNSCDPATSSHQRTREIRDAGLKLRWMILGQFSTVREARDWERLLIIEMPGLVNLEYMDQREDLSAIPIDRLDKHLTRARRITTMVTKYARRGRPQTITDMKSYKAQKQREYRARKPKVTT